MPTQYSTYTYNSPSRIRRWIHTARFSKAMSFTKAHKQSQILDFGAGDGYFSKKLSDQGYHSLYSYEPVEDQYRQMKASLYEYPQIRCIKDEAELLKNSYNYIFCLEVLEHLPDQELSNVLSSFETLLKPKGKIIISVPLESGLGGFFKNLIKKKIDHDKSLSISELWKISRGKQITRIVDHSMNKPYIFKHIGFNNRKLEKQIHSADLTIEKKSYFPMPILFSIFNSQVFYLISKKSY